jgi:predicted dehydrogenase
MLKVAIIGCGKIADAHASQICRIQGCEIVGVCDREELMAKQLYERFSVKNYYDEVQQLLDQARPDVVHITTPPQSHFELAKLCLERGCHAYVEKPFALNAKDAEILIALAGQVGRKLTAGHDLQYSHVAQKMRELIKKGYLGGNPVHIESYYGYDLGGVDYAKALLQDKSHWVRKLPGKLLHNLISHGVARIAEFVETESVEVIAHGFTSQFLRSLGETELVDEMRVIISDNLRTTATFTFSSQMRPVLNQFRIYGPKNGLWLDEDHQTLIKCPGERLKSYAEKFVSPVMVARQYLANAAQNARHFWNNDFHMKSGLKYLIERFYGAINGNWALPISYREIVLTAKIMDEIFAKVDLHRRALPVERAEVADLATR